MANIFGVSHILPTYFMSVQASDIKAKYERNEENIDHIVRDKRAIISLSLT